MYKHLIAVFIFVLTFVSSASMVGAQQGVQNGTNNQAPATENRGQPVGTTEDRGGFDWRWLLPLLAIPVLFMFKKDNKDENRTRYQDHSYAGSKGGKSRSDRDSDEDSQ